MSVRKQRIAVRCAISFILFAITYNMHVRFLDHGWAVLMSRYPGYPSVEYWYNAYAVAHPETNPFSSEHPYMNILRWNGPRHNYNRDLHMAYATRCTYLQVWAMCISFFVIRHSPWSYVKAITISGLFVSCINLIRLTILYGAVIADIPWWLAHDVPNITLGLVALGLSVGYFLRTLPAPQESQAQPAGAETTVSV